MPYWCVFRACAAENETLVRYGTILHEKSASDQE
ncbi:hypothetical protein PM3016_3081 [Paenibacillus mucilaginosus 3016]|uniref:Uncharacterized protein n=1 Tax=Paenibacillus mucilaginosus 3016 TaxID=1116391 RepID=H6NAM2_9BACL|nr:hypothetical protein PM3016_3081 [Paenibacillus mucilaginosus 3016]